MKYWPEAPESYPDAPESVKSYEIHKGSLTIKHIKTTSNAVYDLREFELTKTEKVGMFVGIIDSMIVLEDKYVNFSEIFLADKWVDSIVIVERRS